MTWQFSVCPVAPQCCGATPTDLTPVFGHLGVVGDQHPVLAAQVGHHVVADLIAQHVGVPARPTRQPLQPVRRAVPDMIGQLPAVLPSHIGQQPAHQVSEGRPRFRAGEQRAGDPLGQDSQVLVPAHDLIVGDVVVHT